MSYCPYQATRFFRSTIYFDLVCTTYFLKDVMVRNWNFYHTNIACTSFFSSVSFISCITPLKIYQRSCGWRFRFRLPVVLVWVEIYPVLHPKHPRQLAWLCYPYGINLQWVPSSWGLWSVCISCFSETQFLRGMLKGDVKGKLFLPPKEESTLLWSKANRLLRR